MSKKPSQVTTIGFFILTATVLLVAMLIAFGGSSWLRSTVSYTMRFNSSVKGLAAGSPVLFRGVKIGQVTEIRLLSPGEQPAAEAKHPFPADTVHFPVLVTVDLDPEKLGFPNGTWYNWFRQKGFGHTSKDDLEEYLAEMVLKQGLRAKLQTVSLLTGQLSIELVFTPGTMEKDNLERIESDLHLNIFPTRLGFFDQVSNRIGERNFRNQMESLQKLIAQLSDFIDSGRSQQFMEDIAVIAANLRNTTTTLDQELPTLVKDTRDTLADARGLIGNANGKIQPLIEQAQHLMTRIGLASEAARLLLTTLDNLADTSRPQVELLLTKLNDTVAEAEITLQDTRSALHDAQGVIGPDAPIRQQLANTLAEAQNTINSLHTLLDNLNRNPQLLLLGE